ncbi:alpha-crystallin B chain-like [Thrips palmi]|uniref:Alpha-crystallin B chain-like n=1 Tax=Thrips palmi TaxID=161013 RepID=A0A6P8YIK9_THRPL|nr:alpha-crystallin B chain-like [Thrips palmi]
MLPYILSELRDLSFDEEEPRRFQGYQGRHGHQGHQGHHQGYQGDVADLLNELLLHRPVARASLRPGVVRLVDASAPEQRERAVRRQSYPGRPSILQLLKRELGEMSRPDDGKNAFIVNVDVQDYRPEELSVQVTKDDGYVVVEGSHEERPDEHGLVRRQFTRRYKLPDGVDPDSIKSKLTADGVLQVSAPLKALPAPDERVRQVPITCSKQPLLQQHPEEENQSHAEEDKQAGGEDKAQAQNES